MAHRGRRLKSHLSGTMAVQQGAEDKLGRFSILELVPCFKESAMKPWVELIRGSHRSGLYGLLAASGRTPDR